MRRFRVISTIDLGRTVADHRVTRTVVDVEIDPVEAGVVPAEITVDVAVVVAQGPGGTDFLPTCRVNHQPDVGHYG